MKLQQQLPDPIRGQLIEVVGISSLIFFGLMMVFFGWLKEKEGLSAQREEKIAILRRPWRPSVSRASGRKRAELSARVSLL
jgi:hypothetical protein